MVCLSVEGDFDDIFLLELCAVVISCAEADELIRTLEAKLGSDMRHFYTGVSYRHCLLWKDGDDTYDFARPHDIIGKRIGPYLPSGDRGKPFYDLMRASYDILKNHPVNVARRNAGKHPANSAWLWSPGKKPALPSFADKWGLRGAVISAVDLIKGIGID